MSLVIALLVICLFSPSLNSLALLFFVDITLCCFNLKSHPKNQLLASENLFCSYLSLLDLFFIDIPLCCFELFSHSLEVIFLQENDLIIF